MKSSLLDKIASSKWTKIFSILFIVSFIVYTNIQHSNHVEEKYRQDIALGFKSLVFDKYLDKPNHNSETCILIKDEDTTIFKFDFDKSGVFDYIDIGDSILKPIGDSTIIIKRRNKLKKFTLDY